MKVISLPPFTKICIGVFITLSILTSFLRYTEYTRQYADATKPKIQPDTDEHPLPETVYPQYKDIIVPYLMLVPSLSIIYPWVVLTTSMIEQSLTGFIVTGAAILYGGKYCERVWNTQEFAKFMAIQCVIPPIITSFSLVTLYAVTGNEQLLLKDVSGGTAIQAGFLVAFKQLVPEHSIVLFQGALKSQVKLLVMPLLLMYTILGIVLRSPVLVLLPWTGFFTAWVYLRFYRLSFTDSPLPVSEPGTGSQVPERSEIRGDASDTFSLAGFFYPAPVRDAIATVSEPVFSLLVALKVCTPFSLDEVESGNFRASLHQSGGPGAGLGIRTAEESEADRRRALALKVLEERLEGKK